MKILNLKVRMRNPVFWVQMVMSVFIPILAYANLSPQDVTSWSTVFYMILAAVSNPYICLMVLVSVWNALNDPTTRGISDSINVMGYEQPNPHK